MPISTMPTVAHGDIFEPGIFNTYLRDNITLLDSRTGGDPGATGKILGSSSGTAGVWEVKAESDQITSAKVNKTVPTVTSFAAAVAQLSAFVRVNNSPSIADAPTAALDWLLIQVRHPSVGVDYRLQITSDLTNQDELYTRMVVNAVPGTWRKIVHTGNLAAIFSALALTVSSLSATTSIAAGTHITAGGNIGATGTGTFGGLLSALSAAITSNATVGGTLGVTSTFSAAAAAIGGNVTVGGTLDVTGAISGPGAVPLGGVIWFELLAELTAAGASWARYTAADGRLLIGAGTTFSQTFLEGQNYGASWTPASAVTANNGTLAASSAAIAATATAQGFVTAGATGGYAAQLHTHPAPAISLSGSVAIAGTSTAWLPPSRAGVWGRRIS
jgi:hypothetical protein